MAMSAAAMCIEYATMAEIEYRTLQFWKTAWVRNDEMVKRCQERCWIYSSLAMRYRFMAISALQWKAELDLWTMDHDPGMMER